VVEKCPDCSRVVSKIPMNIDEICSITYDDKRGVTIRFDRKKTYEMIPPESLKLSSKAKCIRAFSFI
jgi:hypothetical protein